MITTLLLAAALQTMNVQETKGPDNTMGQPQGQQPMRSQPMPRAQPMQPMQSMPMSTAPDPSTATTAMGADVPRCSATVTDSCMEGGSMGRHMGMKHHMMHKKAMHKTMKKGAMATTATPTK